MVTRTPTIDSQVHAYERNRPERPWHGFLQGPDEVTGDDMVAAMDAVGVDGALLVSPFSMYRYDASYALEVYAKHPNPVRPDPALLTPSPRHYRGRYGPVDRHDRRGRGSHHAQLRRVRGPTTPGVNRILAAGGRAGVPVNVMCAAKLP